jgi:hypothetical protein
LRPNDLAPPSPLLPCQQVVSLSKSSSVSSDALTGGDGERVGEEPILLQILVLIFDSGTAYFDLTELLIKKLQIVTTLLQGPTINSVAQTGFRRRKISKKSLWSDNCHVGRLQTS